MLFTEILYSIRVQIQGIFVNNLFKNKELNVNPYDKLSYKIKGDPDREVVLGESVHCLAFTLCFNRVELNRMLADGEPEKTQLVHIMPNDSL